METIKLEALARDPKESAKQILSQGFVPAILYGNHVKENKTLKIKSSVMEKAFASAGESTLIDLTIDKTGESKKILIKDSQKHLLKDTLIHVDFYEVDMKKEIHTAIPLNFIGESKAVKEMGGALIKNLDEIEVKCLPNDLVNHIDIDISILETFNDAIKLSEIKLPEKIKLASEVDIMVANVVAPREEIEEEVEEEVVEGEEGEGKEGKEGEEGEGKEGKEGEGKEGKPAPGAKEGEGEKSTQGGQGKSENKK